MKYLGILYLLSLPLVAQDGKPEPTSAETIDPTVTRELIRQWVLAERLISEEKTTWQVEKQRMQDLLDLYQKELSLLNEEVSQAGTAAESVSQKKQTYQQDLDQYRDAQQLLSSTLAKLLPRVRVLIPRLPKPLQDDASADIEVLLDPKAMDNPRDVLKSLLAVFAASGRFNRSVTVVEETRVLSGGKKMTVDVLYLGLARAYYASGAGETAGVGVPGDKEWSWQEKPDIADDIRRVLAVYRKEGQPQLIKLPVSLSSSSSTK